MNVTIDENTEMLNTVDQVMTVLQDRRYSPEQVHKIFQRLTDDIPNERLEQSMAKVPRLELLMLACCKLDTVWDHARNWTQPGIASFQYPR